MRFALYFSPGAESQLGRLGAAWLGRDAWGGETAARPEFPAGLGDVAEPPARYGFHATLKAPFRLPQGSEPALLRAAAAELSKRLAPVPDLGLCVGELGGFLALVPTRAHADAARLAFAVVRKLDGFRAAMTPEERQRRRPETLSPAQQDYLDRWGYPYIDQEFRFHMTLTKRLEDADARQTVKALAERWFAPALEAPMALDRLVLFEEAAPGVPFAAKEAWTLEGRA